MSTTSCPGCTFAPTRTPSSAKRSRRSSGVIGADHLRPRVRAVGLLAPVEVARPTPETFVEGGPLHGLRLALGLVALAGPRQRGRRRLRRLHAVQRLLESRLLLALEKGVVLEGVLDRVSVDR